MIIYVYALLSLVFQRSCGCLRYTLWSVIHFAAKVGVAPDMACSGLVEPKRMALEVMTIRWMSVLFIPSWIGMTRRGWHRLGFQRLSQDPCGSRSCRGLKTSRVLKALKVSVAAFLLQLSIWKLTQWRDRRSTEAASQGDSQC